MFDKPVLGTNTSKTKLNWWDYWIAHCWMTGWQSIHGAFCIWRDLMTGNYKDYALMWYDDPYEECVSWFWGTLGEDDTYPKEFLEELMEMCARIDRGEEELIPMDEVFARLENLIGDVELDDGDV